MSRSLGMALLFAMGGVVAAAGVRAGEVESTPRIDGEIAVEIQNDWTYDSDDPDAELNDLFTTTEPTINLHLLPELTITAHGVLEPVRDPGPSESRFFEDHGLLLEDLFVNYETAVHESDGETVTIAARGGKFTPNFGIAWDAAPGVYGADFAEDTYEFAERIGLGGGVTYSGAHAGSHTLSASTFFVDTSPLSDLIITERGRTRRQDGGVGNTEDFSSFAVAVDGGELPFLPNFAYHLAYIHQGKADVPDLDEGVGVESEKGFAIGGQYTFALPTAAGDIELIPLVEYAHFTDADGVDGQDRALLTTSLQAVWQGWNMALSGTTRNTDVPGGSDVDDFMFQVSAGYEFDFGLTADVGWRLSEEENVDQENLGFLVGYTIEF